ncbi:MAG TPA: lyase family protein [Solirubrobacteraceae bacterium]|nr:lyase family protein [Solirubrobacteraceae bacterium]
MTSPQPFSLLLSLFGDPEMNAILSLDETVRGWLRAEAALAEAQCAADLLSADATAAIVRAAVPESIDMDALLASARNVGYPILPLVRMIDAAAGSAGQGRVHLGATTQDIMDTGLALQLQRAAARLQQLTQALGDALALLVERERDTVMAARTHAQQAVPTTFGAKIAVFLGEVTRHRERLTSAAERVAFVSLHGAGGTSAALGERAAEVRASMAQRLGLRASAVPWHVARDGIAELGQVSAQLAATTARLGREVVALSRTEIGELAEREGHHRGASSTMPQKTNPIGSEAAIGMAIAAGATSAALLRAMEAGHERAAGEWQVEWHVLPQVLALSAGALATAGEVARELQVRRDAMRSNAGDGRGLIMAEAYMMRLAPTLGRERAHDLVYEAAQQARGDGLDLEGALRAVGRARGIAQLAALEPLGPEDHLGQTGAACAEALAAWHAPGGDAPAALASREAS